MESRINFDTETVDFENLYLNPNNLRFAHFDSGGIKVSKDKIKNESVQESAFDKIKAEEFQIKALRDSILEVGFLPIDRIVVTKLDDSSYLVIEGNRRLAALKWIDNMIKEGIADKTVRETFEKIPVNVLKPEDDTEINRLKIQGIRHISEIRPWGTYQKAVLIKSMIEDEKLSAKEVANAIGSRTQEVNRVYRAYKLWEQMNDDLDYGEHVRTYLISYFYEAVGRVPLKRFFSYNDETAYFENEENYKLFYKWIIPDPNNGNVQKIPSSTNVRDLTKIIANEEALNAFKQDTTTLQGALAIVLKHSSYDWKKEITQAIESLKKIPLDELENFKQEDRELLAELNLIIDKRLSQYDKIAGL